MKKAALSLLCWAFIVGLSAQTRYFDPVYSNIKISPNVVYGSNATVLYLPTIQDPIRQPLLMDVYEPAGDVEPNRPLIILLHSGNYLPAVIWDNCFGTKNDGEVVELAQRLARRGFVVAAADYRLGWTPVAPASIERTFTLVNAVHRSVQDSRTCIRFFRKDHAGANQFRIDPEKITLWGIGTGGFATLNSMALDSMSDWLRPKFLTPVGPLVQEIANGNLDGTTLGIVPPNYPFYPTPGDTLCYPNHPGFSSDFALTVNMGGVLLDSSWLDAGEGPIISFASPDWSEIIPSNEPCGMGDLGVLNPLGLLPTLPDVAGSCAVQALQHAFGGNQTWLSAGFADPLSSHSLSINQGHEGFYPFQQNEEYAPWAFTPVPLPTGASGCDTGFVQASAFLDTVLAYFAPRACAVLGLQPDCGQLSVAAQTPTAEAAVLKITPNPAADRVWVDASCPVLWAELFDLQGRRLNRIEAAGAEAFLLERRNLPGGVYLLRVHAPAGDKVAKLIWE